MKKRLIKLLNLTTSNYDGECLNAIKAANAVLNENNMVWEDFFNDSYLLKKISKLEREIITLKTKTVRSITVKEKIEICLDSIPGSKFLNSIYESYEKYGRLTDRQREVLEEIYNEL